LLKQLEDSPSVAFSIFVFITVISLSDDKVVVIAETDVDLDVEDITLCFR
jgi:hypothetical protein